MLTTELGDRYGVTPEQAPSRLFPKYSDQASSFKTSHRMSDFSMGDVCFKPGDRPGFPESDFSPYQHPELITSKYPKFGTAVFMPSLTHKFYTQGYVVLG